MPSSNVMTIEERPGIEAERMESTQATPLRRFDSRGTVTRSSTSWADSPRASACTSTVTGANSGTGSIGVVATCTAPKAVAPTARMTMRIRRRIAAVTT